MGWRNLIKTEYPAGRRPMWSQHCQSHVQNVQNYVSMVVPWPKHRDTLSPSAKLYGLRTLCDPGSDTRRPLRQDGGASSARSGVRAPLAGTGQAGETRRTDRGSCHWVWLPAVVLPIRSLLLCLFRTSACYFWEGGKKGAGFMSISLMELNTS